MSPREQKLVSFFGLAAFVVVNLFGFKWYQTKRQQLNGQLLAATRKVEDAKSYAENFQSVEGEMDWMMKHMPQPRALQMVQTELEQFASTQARTNQLELKPVKILPPDQTGLRFHRAKIQFAVTGSEANLYRWLDRLQVPDQLRAITFLRLSPEQKDDTKIDCTVIVEQFFIPAGASDEEAAPTPPPPSDPTPPLPPGMNPPDSP